MHTENEHVPELKRVEASLHVRVDLYEEGNYAKQKQRWIKQIASEMREETEKFFGKPIQLEIRIEKGSIVFIVFGGIVAICAFLNAYGGIRSGLSWFTKDVSGLFKKATSIIKRVIGPKEIRKIIEEKIQLGPIAAVDELLQIYIDGKISEEECTKGLVHVFRQIENPKDKDRLIPVATKYIDDVYGYAYPVKKLQKELNVLSSKREEKQDMSKHKKNVLKTQLDSLLEFDKKSKEDEDDFRDRKEGPTPMLR